MSGLLDWLTGARQAKADARHLRDLYGDRAEAWCETMLASLPSNDARRGSVRKIAKALGATASAGPSRSPARVWSVNPVAGTGEACKRSDRRKRPNWA